MKEIIENKSLDQERCLYGISDAEVRFCSFGGPADGESALKETHDIDVHDCDFKMRYVLWHVRDFTLTHVSMDHSTRAALWYDEKGAITDCKLHGIKALRECKDISLARCDISSEEFGWRCDGVDCKDSVLVSVYPFFQSKNLKVENLKMTAKYSFQYIENATFRNCQFETKDAFWHSKDVTVYDSTINGEYMAWYSENLTLVNCHIKGTQPFCYCKNLTLINCTMEAGDLAFEYSSVNAKVVGRVDSIKNPLSGKIEVDELGELITTDSVKECTCRVEVAGKQVL